MSMIPAMPRNVALSGGATIDPDQDRPVEQLAGGALPYRAFRKRHPTYNGAYWQRIRALYEGGETLLQDPAILQNLFIKNGAETEEQFQFRCAIAFYLNYCSEIVDFIVAGLGADPIRIEQDGKPCEDEFVKQFTADSTPPGGDTQDLQALVAHVVREALLTKTAWIELCRPEMEEPEDGRPLTRLDEKLAGADRVYAFVLKAEQVTNWSEDADHDLEWAVVYRRTERQTDFWSEPEIVETWTRWAEESYSEWEIVWPKNKPPQPTDPVPQTVLDKPHTFGRVPLMRFRVKHGLWVMDKLESIARAHFNKANILDFGERRTLIPQLYEFQGAEAAQARMPVPFAQRDPDRATSTPRGPNWVQTRGKDDRAEWVGPDPSPYGQAWNSLDRLRDEMHRIVYQMSLAAQQDSGAALQRSEGSRRLDRTTVMVIWAALGSLVRDWVTDLVRTARKGAGKPELPEEVRAVGAAKFDGEEIEQLVAQTEILLGLQMPSQLAMVEIAMKLLRPYLSHLQESELAEIREQLMESWSPEVLQPMPPIPPGMAPPGGEGDPPPPGKTGAPPPKPGGKPPAAKPKAKPAA